MRTWLLVGLLIAACGRAPEPEPEPIATAVSVPCASEAVIAAAQLYGTEDGSAAGFAQVVATRDGLELRAEGVCVVLTTHDLDEAELLADRIVIIDRGRSVADGTPAELLSGAQLSHFGFRAEAGLDVVSLGASLHTTVSEPAPGEYRVDATPTPRLVAEVTAWLAQHDILLGDLRAGRQRLDDLFLRLTGEGAPGRTRGGRRRRGETSDSPMPDTAGQGR